ncbi:MAG: DNA-directed DNA polymerase [archaeon]
MPEYTFCLLDIDYSLDGGLPAVRMFGRTDKGKSIVVLDKSFEPYFYVLVKDDLKKVEKSIKELGGGEFEIVKVEQEELFYRTEKVKVLKVFTRNPPQVVPAREAVRILPGVRNVYEADILFGRRYIINKGLEPMGMIKVEGKEVKSDLDVGLAVEISKEPRMVDKELPKLNIMSFDIETYSKGGMPQAESDPIMMISLGSEKFKKVLTYKEFGEGLKDVEVLKDEIAMIQRFEEIVRERDVDILTAYNSDNFDMPYLRDRAKAYGHELRLGRDKRAVQFKSRGMYHAAGMKGRVHADLYHYVTIILRGALGQVNKRTLKSIAEKFLPEGIEKGEVDWKNIDAYWKTGEKFKEMVAYSLNDAVITHKLSELFLPREYEIARMVKVPLFDCIRTTYGQLVEAYLMWNAFERDELIPNRPEDAEREQRAQFEAFEGAYVKEPEVGMHENIALFDFRSLYPTIIISHNIDQSTIDCRCCEGKVEKNEETENWFCKKREGLMPAVLKHILEERIKAKKEMKKHEKGSVAYERLDNAQYALKILANSAYGYLAYRGSRWYTRDGASSVTSWGRMYIKKIIGVAEDFGLRVIYGDTDSLFVVAEKGKVKDVSKEFLQKVNKELPGVMELEFEGTYKRGIFVSKKRYALINEKGETSVKGLEFVRKDWSPMSKDTQKRVLESVLEDGKSERAFEIVREVIKRLKDGDFKKEELAIYTDLTRPLDKYTATAPHISVAKLLKKRGEDIHTGSTIGYIIVKGGGMISERARPVDEVKEEQVDTTYYIEHEIVPAVSRVMGALGYEEGELMGKKQFKLGDFGK